MKRTTKRIFSCAVTLAALLSAALPYTSYADETALTAEGSYGQALSDLPLLKGSVNGLPGTWSWLDPTIRPEAGTQNYKVLFTPDDTNNYNTVTAEIPVTTHPALPQILTLPEASGLVYGQALAQSQFAGGSVGNSSGEVLSGTWTWKDGDIQPDAGTSSYDAVFTPDNPNYQALEQTISVVTAKAAISPETVVVPPAASEITYGQKISDSELTGGSVEGFTGVWNWATPETQPAAGTESYELIFMPDNPNYEPMTISVPVTTNKADLSPTEDELPTAGEIIYGQSLRESVLSAKNTVQNVAGTWDWENASTEPAAGTGEYNVSFIPLDNRYLSYTTAVSLKTNPAAPIVQADAAEVSSGTRLADVEISYTAAGVKGEDLTGRFF